jgi:hypothetical protein
MKTGLERLLALGIVVCALSTPCGAQETTKPRQFTVSGHGSLQLNVPLGWRLQDRSLEKPPSVLLRLRPASGDAFYVQVTSVWIDPAKQPSLAPEQVKERVQTTAKDLLKRSVEKEATILELRGKEAYGYYFSLTDQGSASGPQDYKYITQGTAVMGELVTVFTILQREPALPDREQALRIFADAVHSKAEPAAAGSSADATIRIRELEQVFELSVPVSRLVVTIPKAGLVRTKNPLGGSADHPRFFYFVGGANLTFISGWIEPAQRFSGIEKFWENETSGWKRQGLPAPVDVSFVKVDNWDVIIYDMPSPVGNNSHVRAHRVQAGTWIDMHISTIQKSSTESRSKLLALLQTIEVRERK